MKTEDQSGEQYRRRFVLVYMEGNGLERSLRLGIFLSSKRH